MNKKRDRFFFGKEITQEQFTILRLNFEGYTAQYIAKELKVSADVLRKKLAKLCELFGIEQSRDENESWNLYNLNVRLANVYHEALMHEQIGIMFYRPIKASRKCIYHENGKVTHDLSLSIRVMRKTEELYLSYDKLPNTEPFDYDNPPELEAVEIDSNHKCETYIKTIDPYFIRWRTIFTPPLQQANDPLRFQRKFSINDGWIKTLSDLKSYWRKTNNAKQLQVQKPYIYDVIKKRCFNYLECRAKNLFELILEFPSQYPITDPQIHFIMNSGVHLEEKYYDSFSVTADGRKFSEAKERSSTYIVIHLKKPPQCNICVTWLPYESPQNHQ